MRKMLVVGVSTIIRSQNYYNVCQINNLNPISYSKRCFLNNYFMSNIKYYTTRKTERNILRNANEGFDETKAKLVLKMNFLSTEDALPFCKLPITKLIHIYKCIKNDERNKFCSNRLYYISNKIKCPPFELSEYLAKRLFIFSLSFNWLEDSLNVLLEMNVSGDRILRDLWVLKYHHATIRERLQKVKDMGLDNLYPWMVRCNESILNRSIAIAQERKNILGDIGSTQSYLAYRLNISAEEIENMCSKEPRFKTMSVIKVKHFLDYLQGEGFEIEEIVRTPRILFTSPKTVQQRLHILRELGLTISGINLNVLCRSADQFNKYVDSMESMYKNTKYYARFHVNVPYAFWMWEKLFLFQNKYIFAEVFFYYK